MNPRASAMYLMSLGLTLVACVMDPSTTEEGSEAVSEEALTAPAGLFTRARVIDGPNVGSADFATAAQAQTAALAVLAQNKQAELASCAVDFGVTIANVFGRFDGCVSSANGPFGPAATWQGSAKCQVSFCATKPIDSAEVVRFDGSADLKTESGDSLHANDDVILVFDRRTLAHWVSSTSEASGVIALVPHLYVRTDGGAFFEAPAIPAPSPKPGPFTFVTAPGSPSALLVHLAPGADRLELYVRFERWHYSNGHFATESVVNAHLDSRIEDGYISNFGKNFKLSVN